MRRFFRILPPALVVMLAYRVLADFIPQKYGPVDVWWSEIVPFFGSIYNYGHPYRRDLKLGVYWSLAVEEHFYLLLPVLFVVFRTRGRRIAACGGALQRDGPRGEPAGRVGARPRVLLPASRRTCASTRSWRASSSRCF